MQIIGNTMHYSHRLQTATKPTHHYAIKTRTKLNLPKGTQQKPQFTYPENSESLPDFLIWVKNEPFDFGIISPFTCQKIGINVLRKIAVYCKQKPDHCPELSWNQWNHICKYKMQLPNELTAAYFRVFHVLTSNVGKSAEMMSDKVPNHYEPDEIDDSWDAKFNRALKQGVDSLYDFSVDTLQFLVLLYIQHFSRLRKRVATPCCVEDEPWPGSQNGLGGRGRPPTSAAALVPEQQHANFILANLRDIIEFLMLLSNQNSKQSEESKRVPVGLMRALSFVLGAASTTLEKEFSSLDECLVLHDIAYQLNYNPETRTVDQNRFVNWIKSNLKTNPWGPSSIPIPQAQVSAQTGVCGEAEAHSQNRIYWNTQSYPKTWFLVSGVEKQVLLLDSLQPMCSLKIHRCADSYIYVPGVHKIVFIQKCHRVNVNVGVAAKVVKISDCSDITVSGVGRMFIICDVTGSCFNLLTPFPPIICGNKNRRIRLGPYNTRYPNLNAHMKIAKISSKVQKWSKPLEISSTDGMPIDKSACSNCQVVRPEQFQMGVFPFNNIGMDNSSEQCYLPIQFTRRNENVGEIAERVKQEFCAKMVADEDANVILLSTQQRFRKWLKESGNYELIIGLRSFHKSLEQKSLTPVACSKGHDLACVSKSMRVFFNCGVRGGDLEEKLRSKVGKSREKFGKVEK